MGKFADDPSNQPKISVNESLSHRKHREKNLGSYASYLERSEAERELLKERISEADQGIFISSEAMLRWINSWGTKNELPPPEPDVLLPPRRT